MQQLFDMQRKGMTLSECLDKILNNKVMLNCFKETYNYEPKDLKRYLDKSSKYSHHSHFTEFLWELTKNKIKLPITELVKEGLQMWGEKVFSDVCHYAITMKDFYLIEPIKEFSTSSRRIEDLKSRSLSKLEEQMFEVKPLKIDKKVDLRLSGVDENAYNILSLFQKAARRAKWTSQEINYVIWEAKQSDYDNLLYVICSYSENPMRCGVQNCRCDDHDDEEY